MNIKRLVIFALLIFSKLTLSMDDFKFESGDFDLTQEELERVMFGSEKSSALFEIPFDFTDKNQFLNAMSLVTGNSTFKQSRRKTKEQNQQKIKLFKKIADEDQILSVINKLIEKEELTDLRKLLEILENKSRLNIEMIKKIIIQINERKKTLKPAPSKSDLELAIEIDLNKKIQELVLKYLKKLNGKNKLNNLRQIEGNQQEQDQQQEAPNRKKKKRKNSHKDLLQAQKFIKSKFDDLHKFNLFIYKKIEILQKLFIDNNDNNIENEAANKIQNMYKACCNVLAFLSRNENQIRELILSINDNKYIESYDAICRMLNVNILQLQVLHREFLVLTNNSRS